MMRNRGVRASYAQVCTKYPTLIIDGSLMCTHSPPHTTPRTHHPPHTPPPTQCDVRKPDDCTAAVAACIKHFARLDILVNCAAGNFLAVAEEMTPNGFKTVMEIDTIGTFVMSRAAFPHLCAAGGASVINISATLHYGATWYQAHASAAKAAIDSLTRSLALEWGEFGVRVNGVAPGPIQDTAGTAKLLPASDEAARTQAARAMIPLGRWGTKWDIAMACVFLCSSAASFVTGDTMVVDGANWMYRTPLLPRSAVSKASRGIESGSRRVGLASPGGAQSKL